jgi:hypothetical protein
VIARPGADRPNREGMALHERLTSICLPSAAACGSRRACAT